MFNKTLSAILRGIWMIEPQWANAHLPQVARLLQGEQFNPAVVAADPKNIVLAGESKHLPIALHPDAHSGFVTASRYRRFSDAPEGSVALIPIAGPIMKYEGECGEPGSMNYAQWVKEAAGSPNISGIIIKIDSPGGQVDGTQTLVDAIVASKKKTIGFVDDGMMCSAGMWIGAACDEIYASQKTDVIGSIGVLCSFYDFRGRLEQLGIKLHEIYAPQSSDKNIDFKEALEGNYAKIEAELKVLADAFITSVKTLRGSRLNSTAGDPFTGKTYFAPEAQALGLIDGICTFEQAILKASGENSN